jgi:hypothetical protein
MGSHLFANTQNLYFKVSKNPKQNSRNSQWYIVQSWVKSQFKQLHILGYTKKDNF